MGSRRLLVLLSLAVLFAAAAGVAALSRCDGAPVPEASGDLAGATEGGDPGVPRLEGLIGECGADARGAAPPDGPPEGDDLVTQRSGRVTGRILGPHGRPVDGATAGYDSPWGESLDDVEADAEGRFVFVRRAGHTFTVLAVAPGHGIAVGPRVHLSVGQTVDVGTLHLEKGFAISGGIVDADGEPAVGVEVAVQTEANPVSETWARMWSANEAWHFQETDKEGRFVFENLPEGVYRVMVAYGISETWDEVRRHVPTGTDDLRFVAPAGAVVVDGRIRVRAVGPDGETIPHFRARLDAANGVSSSSRAAGGELEIGSEVMVAPVRLTVWDAHDDERQQLGYGVAVVRAVEARAEPYVVHLARGGHVGGRVFWSGEPRSWLLHATGRVDEDGTFARGSRSESADLPLLQFTTKSDLSGAFRFDGFPPGEVVIGLRGGGSFRLEGNEVVVEVGREDVVLRMIATGTIRVRVHAPEGKMIRWGAARLKRHVAGGLASAGTSTAGSNEDQAYFDFKFGDLDLAGRFRLETNVVAAGRTYTGEVRDELTPREERYEVHVEEGLSITGRVVRRDGTPVPDAEVHYRPHPAGGYFDPYSWEVGERHYTEATTGKDGSFVLTGLDPADVILTVVTPGLCLTGPPRRVSAGARDLSLVVAPAWRISGHVEDDAGGRVNDLRVAAVSAQGEVPFWTPHRVAADGFFEVEGLHEGTWRIVGWSRERDDDTRYVVSEPAVAGTKDVRLVVRRGCSLRGVVRTAEGAKISGATVRLVGPWTHRRKRTRDDGAYAFAGVPPGSYVLEVRTPLGSEVRRPFVAAASTEALEIDVVVP